MGVDDRTSSASAVDSACFQVPVLYSIGFCITFSSLFCKLDRVRMIFNNTKLKKITVTGASVIKNVVGLLLVDIILLALWATNDPLVWVRTTAENNVDPFTGLSTESTGKCTSIGGTFMAYLGPLAAVHVFVLIVGNVVAWKVRKVSDEFSESKYVAIAMMSNFQIMVLGIPILIMVADNSVTNYFLRVGIVFLNDFGVLCLIFFPKFFRHYFDETASINTAASSYKSSSVSTFDDNEVSVDVESEIIKVLQDKIDKLEAMLEPKP
jgi:uncharacterized Tic20 family protein